jgi:hypothetical protein
VCSSRTVSSIHFIETNSLHFRAYFPRCLATCPFYKLFTVACITYSPPLPAEATALFEYATERSLEIRLRGAFYSQILSTSAQRGEHTPKSFFFTLLKKEQALDEEEEEGGAEKKSWCVRDLKREAHSLHTHTEYSERAQIKSFAKSAAMQLASVGRGSGIRA